MNEAETLVKKITEGIQEKKGKNIVIADLTAIDPMRCDIRQNNLFIFCGTRFHHTCHNRKAEKSYQLKYTFHMYKQIKISQYKKRKKI